MPKLGPNAEEQIREAYERRGSIRGASEETGHSYNAAARILGGKTRPKAGQGIDYEMLSTMVAAKLSRSVVNEGPLAPPALAVQAQTTQPGVYRSPKIYERIVWLSDLHYPYADEPAVNCALDYIESWNPTLIVIGGDLFDAYMVSSYEKSPEQLNHHLQREFDLAKPFVKRIDAVGSHVVYILGNHEARIDALIGKNPGLAKLRALQWDNMAELPKRWTILPQHSRFRVGGLDFHHGDIKTGPGGRYVAARLLEDLKRSSIFGHFHRNQSYFEPDGDGVVRGSFASGHLCNVHEAAKYCKLNRWTTGFLDVEMCPSTELFEVRSHLIHSGKMRTGGRTYGG